jgi:hypothetical protein
MESAPLSPEPGDVSYQKPPTSGLAVASLVSAVLGLLFLPCSLAAIVLGFVALSKIKGAQGRLGGRGLAIAGVAVGTVGLVLVLVVLGLMLPGLERARERVRRAKSACNLLYITKCCYLYADATANQGRFPDDPMALYPNYLRDWRALINPRLPDQDVGYEYLPGSSLEDDPNVVAYENVPEDRANEGRNVVVARGNVEWMSDEDFQAALAETRRVQQKAGRSTRPVPISVSAVKMTKGP